MQCRLHGTRATTNCELADLLEFASEVAFNHSSSLFSCFFYHSCEFRKVNGHCVVPRSNGRLGAWVEKQRIEYKKYQAMHEESICDRDASPKSILTEERVKKLDAIGFVWDVREKQFQQKLGQLRIYKEMNRSIDPRYMSGSLALWVRKCEQQYRRYLDAVGAGLDEETVSGILPENRRIALENVGFCRSMFDEPRARSAGNRRSSWEERFEELEQYKAEVRAGYLMLDLPILFHRSHYL